MKSHHLIIWAIIAAACAALSWHVGVGVAGTDFPVFYTAATRFLDSGTPIEMIFQTSMEGLDVLPERYPPGNYFIYSPIIAMLFSPLALLSYFQAKSVMMFINIMAYLAANGLLLKMFNRCDWRYFIYSILFMWMPFTINFCAAQVNAIILLLVVTALYFMNRRNSLLAGSVLGIAALFKIFPLAIAMLSGICRRKVAIAGLTVFALALLAPGSGNWLQAMPTVSSGHTPVFLYLSRQGIGWFIGYSAIIVGASMLILYRAKDCNPAVVMAYAVPAALAAMPVVQYHHLIMLSIPYSVQFLSAVRFRGGRLSFWLLAATLVHINLNAFFETIPSSYWSVLTVWGVQSLSLYSLRSSSLAMEMS